MDPTLASLLDERDIINVQTRYAMSLDARDWDAFRTCFAKDAVAVYEGLGEFAGVDAIEELCKRALLPLTRSQHLLGNHCVQVDGDSATAQCYYQAQHLLVGTEGGDTFVIAGKYADDFVRTADGWRLQTRTLEIWWTDGNAAVIAA